MYTMDDTHQAQKNTQAEMLSIAVHQLRAPLTRNKWLIDMLLHDEEAHLPDQFKEYLTNINTNNETVIVMVNDMLKANREEITTVENPAILI